MQQLLQHPFAFELQLFHAEWVDTSEMDDQSRSANVIASVMAGADAACSPQQQTNGGDGEAKIDVLRCGEAAR